MGAEGGRCGRNSKSQSVTQQQETHQRPVPSSSKLENQNAFLWSITRLHTLSLISRGRPYTTPLFAANCAGKRPRLSICGSCYYYHFDFCYRNCYYYYYYYDYYY